MASSWPGLDVVGGLGDDEDWILDGARIFDVTKPSRSAEVLSFAGPGGRFFSDGNALLSADQSGLSRWNASSGHRTGHIPGFQPTHYHRGAREFVRVDGGMLVRWRANGYAD